MELVQVTFDRLFNIARHPHWRGSKRTHFGFESKGKRYFDISVPEWPRIEEGMTVIALLKNPNDWGTKSLLGWIDCTDGSIVCEAPSLYFGIFAVLIFFLFLFAVSDVQNPWVADLVVAIFFGGGAISSLYKFSVAFLVKRALIAARNQPQN